MALDSAKNFAKVQVSTGYDASATSIDLETGHGARLPTPPFNAVWWNVTDYPDPSDDPNREIVRVTGISTDTLTVTRAQESTSASTKNTGSKTYLMIAGPTAKLITDIAALAAPGGSDKEVQFNNSGAFAGAKLEYTEAAGDDGGLTLKVPDQTVTGNPGRALAVMGADGLGTDQNGGVLYFQGGSPTGSGARGGVYLYRSDGNAGVDIDDLGVVTFTNNNVELYGYGTDSRILLSNTGYNFLGKYDFEGHGGKLGTLDFSNIASSDKTFTFPNTTGNVVVDSATQTLTNKRVTPRVSSETSSATPTINTDNVDAHSITALAADITSMTTNLSGTPTNFQKLLIRIKDNGTARAITWGASFEAKGVALPTTTVISKVLTVGFIYDTVTSKWGCVASAQEA